MSGYSVDIEQRTLKNEFFREVLHTARHLQLVVMTLQPGEDIGMETHPNLDQFIRVEAGVGEAIVPAGAEHNVVNTSAGEPLRLYTIYAPPEHPDGTVNRTKEDAEAYERQRHGHA
jgi:mannose-6-phosphate isomerase-like protein (cupin superfamily)